MADDPREQLYARIRPLLGPGEQANQAARAIVGLFGVVEHRDHDVDVTALNDTRRQLLRQRWIVAAVADGPAQHVQGALIGLDLDPGAQP